MSIKKANQEKVHKLSEQLQAAKRKLNSLATIRWSTYHGSSFIWIVDEL